MYSLMHDSFDGARVVKAFGQEEHENRRFAKVNGKAREAEMHTVWYGSLLDIAFTIGEELPVLLVWVLGSTLVLHSAVDFSYGMLMTFINYLTMLQGPMSFFSNIFRFWTSSMNAAQRVFEIVDADAGDYRKPPCQGFGDPGRGGAAPRDLQL